MEFWHTVLAILVGNAAYDVLWALISPDEGDKEDDDFAGT